MFTDSRSKRIVLVAHCVLNQNSISDGTADFPGSVSEIVSFLLRSGVGIVQMPCPEMLCLGLDRGDVHGGERPVIVENTRIRQALKKPSAARTIKSLVNQLVLQIEQYQRNGFAVLGIIGIDRSPSCGVNTTSMNNQEVEGEGVFVKALRVELEKKNIQIDIVGIKGLETGKALMSIKNLFGKY